MDELIEESNEISDFISELEIKECKTKHGISIPNCLCLSSLFYFGACQIGSREILNQVSLNPRSTDGPYFDDQDQFVLNQKNFKNWSFFQIPRILKNKPIKKSIFQANNILPEDFYFFYDRNPNIIKNLIKVSTLLYPEVVTKYYCLDDISDPEEYIAQKLTSDSLKVYSYAIFYTNNMIKRFNIPLFSYGRSKGGKLMKSYSHFLQMAIGMEKQICCLHLFSPDKSFCLYNGVITEDNRVNLSDFRPFILLYNFLYLKDPIDENPNYFYDAKRNTCINNSLPTPPSMSLKDDYSREFIDYLYSNQWLKKEYTFQQYLIQCLKFPAAFVAGTDYPVKRYGHYLTVIFSNNESIKDNIIKNVETEIQSGCKELCLFYQKFFPFLKFLISLISAFRVGDCNQFIEKLKYLFSMLPVINPFITSPFIDLIKHLANSIEPNASSDYKKFNNNFNELMSCTINDGKELDKYLNRIIPFSKVFDSSAITISQAYHRINNEFNELKKYFNDEDLSFIRTIKLSEHDKSKDYIFYKELKDSISSSYLLHYDILI